ITLDIIIDSSNIHLHSILTYDTLYSIFNDILVKCINMFTFLILNLIICFFVFFLFFFFFFFFSSRRRHTRFDCDWSSDVCSSDLLAPGRYWIIARPVVEDTSPERTPPPLAWDADARAKLRHDAEAANLALEIGRASCRERV